jgi:hypothetical protein
MRLLASLLYLILCCATGWADSFSLKQALSSMPHIDGKTMDGQYLCVTASPKVYAIGNQQGQFPNAGWHIPGEMGGVWMHPIKLIDGYEFTVNGKSLGKASGMTTYPFAQQFRYTIDKIGVVRTDFAVDSLPVLVSELYFTNNTSKTITIDLGVIVRSNLMPTWLSDRMGIVDGKDTLLSYSKERILMRDTQNDWFAGVQLSGIDNMVLSSTDKVGNKRIFNTDGKVTISGQSSATVRLFISGSLLSIGEVTTNLSMVRDHLSSIFKEKAERYANIKNTAKVDIPDKHLQQAYEWGKYSTDWLVRDVQGLGRGLSAGLPDYPWFFSNDQSSTFNAIVGTCDPSLIKESLYMLLRHSMIRSFGVGNIIHEMSTNGQIYNTDRKDECQDFIHAVWNLYKWTGDSLLLHDMYPEGMKIYDYLMAHDSNHNLFVEGSGGVEIEGLDAEMFDVACNTAEFFKDMKEMSLEKGEKENAKMFAAKADTLVKRINAEWWNNDNHRYYDILADKSKALQLIDNALKDWVSPERNKWALKYLTNLKTSIEDGSYLKRGYDIFFNPSVLALTTGVADTTQARAYLENVKWFCNKFGLYISGISRPDNIHSEECSVLSRAKNGFNYKQAVMPGNTSSLAIAECKYNNADSAMVYIRKLLNSFSYATPGTTYEVSPDYGQFVQAWNVCGINIPIIQYFFGISPMASHKQIELHPDMPQKWNNASINNVLVGTNKLGVSFNQKRGKNTWNINLSEDGWKVIFHLPRNVHDVKVNGKIFAGSIIELYGRNNVIEYVK